MSFDRLYLVRKAFEKKAVPISSFGAVSGYFGELVFDRPKMRQYLSPTVFNSLLECIDLGYQLDANTADGVAEGMKKWAIEHGVTHITHWFQPLTEGTAEKHDALISFDEEGKVIETFEGKDLIQQEPDASSFPNGGIRATFEARGYTAWDPTSPVFIQEDTLCIPTVFVSYTGEALDYKTPLKRSLKALSDAAVPICQFFDPSVTKVISFMGWEQEFFLVDELLYVARPDLMITGRTLFGHTSSKSQQLGDHYFGAIPSRVASFMRDLEMSALRLAIPVKTRHNEVAPNQFEIAPIFVEANLANDQNLILMNLMHEVGKKHGFVVLLHEKPFAGVNGSGKHNNWSLATDTGIPLLAPGKTIEGNLQFVTFFVNVLAAVQRHNGLLKASIASATNAHRLGQNEAPPAIISAFLGDTMTRVLKQLLEVPSGTPIVIKGKTGKKLGLVELPEIFVDNTDRNRTSPFAFTGNRFEFRAVGASANCAGPLTTLNAAVAEQLQHFKQSVDKELASGKSKEVAIMDSLKPIIASILPVVCFDGNGYSDEWREEAKNRGLDTESNVPRLFELFTSSSSVQLFISTGVFSKKELEARNEVKWETYVKKIQIESRVMSRMALNHIIPAALAYKAALKPLAENGSVEETIINSISQNVSLLYQRVDILKQKCALADRIEDMHEKALKYQEISDYFSSVRHPVDNLEEIVDNKLWPLPKYRELMFIS